MLRGCYDEINLRVMLVNTNTAAVIATSEPEYHPDLINNRHTLAVDVHGKTAVWGAVGTHNDSKLHVFQYSETSMMFEKSCPLPVVSSDIYTSPPEDVTAEPHCSVFSEGRWFVVYDKPYGNGIVAELDTDACTFTELGRSPHRIRGSRNGKLFSPISSSDDVSLTMRRPT